MIKLVYEEKNRFAFCQVSAPTRSRERLMLEIEVDEKQLFELRDSVFQHLENKELVNKEKRRAADRKKQQLK